MRGSSWRTAVSAGWRGARALLPMPLPSSTNPSAQPGARRVLAWLRRFWPASVGITTTNDSVTLFAGQTLSLEEAIAVGSAQVNLTSDFGAIDSIGAAAVRAPPSLLAPSSMANCQMSPPSPLASSCPRLRPSEIFEDGLVR